MSKHNHRWADYHDIDHVNVVGVRVESKKCLGCGTVKHTSYDVTGRVNSRYYIYRKGGAS